MNENFNLENNPNESETNKKELDFQKKNLLLSFFLLDIFIFILIASVLDWLTFAKKEYLIFGSAFFIFMMIFYIITRVLNINKLKKSSGIN